ncbi:MAG: glycerophosphodiester phosphodiesterase family protein [Proteobacteria bacterium]|nr:glycerophosphodiester phosphodiesterase family protein [Pseudomonadota bacterium]
MLPAVIGHRGALAVAPENTLAGQAGATWVELDVRFTRDSVPVIFHDNNLKRLAGRPGAIESLTAAEATQLRVGPTGTRETAGAAIPLLADVLDYLIAHDMGVVFEFKPAPKAHARVGLAVQLIAERWPAARPLPVFSSFSLRVMASLARQPKPWPLALIADRLPVAWRWHAARYELSGLHLYHRAITANRVARIKGAGLWVGTYTVNDPAEARRLRSWGVDGIITDDPARLIGAGDLSPG